MQQLRLSDGRLSGRLTTIADYEINIAGVEDVTLRDWLAVSLQTKLEGTDEKLICYVHEETSGAIGSLIIRARPDGRLQIHVYADGPAWEKYFVESVVRQICEANGDALDQITHSDGTWYFELSCTPDDRTTRQMFALQTAFQQMFRLPDQARPTGGLKADGVYHLLKVGGADALLGVAESEWLEVKSQGYDLDDFASKIELAQDVSRFANGSTPALLLLGFRTKRRDGIDTIGKVTPLQLPRNAIVRHRETIDRLVYPAIDNLTVDIFPQKGGFIVVICVPVQPETHKPFLVHGAVVAGRNEGAFISIVQRRDEGTIPMTIAEVHALLAAGRSVLRGSTA